MAEAEEDEDAAVKKEVADAYKIQEARFCNGHHTFHQGLGYMAQGYCIPN